MDYTAIEGLEFNIVFVGTRLCLICLISQDILSILGKAAKIRLLNFLFGVNDTWDNVVNWLNITKHTKISLFCQFFLFHGFIAVKLIV